MVLKPELYPLKQIYQDFYINHFSATGDNQGVAVSYFTGKTRANRVFVAMNLLITPLAAATTNL